MNLFVKNKGYSIIELLVVIVIIGIITAVALKSLRTVNDTARTEKTKKELDQLAFAVSGDPNLTSGGARTDFGYVGDVGSMPPNLDALVSNPGSYATWNGPYLRDDYLPSGGASNTEFKVDEWGTAYNYSGNTITSTGGGSNISRKVANSVNDLVYNSVAVTVTDVNQVPPGNTNKDSVRIVLTHPNGTGGNITKTSYPSSGGFASIDSVPIGQHNLRVIFLPQNDTLTRKVTVNPGELTNVNVNLFRAAWSSAPSTGGGPQSVIIRPMGSGNWSNNDDQGCSSNWQCVDESSSDNDGTYIGDNDDSWQTDSYQAENPSASGTIDSLRIFINVRRTNGNDEARTVIVVSGTRYYGSIIDLNSVTSYTVFSTTYTTNPATSSAWTWSDINNLEIGVRLNDDARCTQVWAQIFYN